MSTETSKRGRIAQMLETGLGRLARASFAKPITSLTVIGVLVIASIFAARDLKLNADLTELLPKSFQSIKDLELLKERFGGVGYVTVVGRGAEPDQLRQFAEDIAPQLEKLKTVRWVAYKRHQRYFEDRIPYFIPTEDLKLIDKRLAARLKYEQLRRNPLYFDLDDAEPPSLEFPELKEKYGFGNKRGTGGGNLLAKGAGSLYYIDEQAKAIVLLCKPAQLASNVDFAKAFVDEVEGFLSSVDLKKYGEDMSFALTGRYKKRTDQQKLLLADLSKATTVAVALVLVFLMFHFRRFAAVGLIIAPLVVGLCWTFGFAGITFGALNILTGFIGAILLGLGIDHGIHLLQRYESEWDSDDVESAVVRTFGNTGRAVIVAALTTTVAFAGVGMSEFRAFHEFGLLAAAGMILVVLSYTTFLPALLGLANRAGWKPYMRAHESQSTIAAWMLREPTRAFGLAIIALVALATGLSGTKFDYDFAALEATHLESFELDKKTNRILGYSQTPIVVLTQSVEEEARVVKEIRSRAESLGDKSGVDFAIATSDLVPPEQELKQPVMASLGETLSEFKTRWLDKQYRQPFKRLKAAMNMPPFTRADIPESVSREFMGVDSKEGQGVVLIFPRISLSDGERVVDLAKEVRGVDVGEGRVVNAAGEAMILADILMMIYRESTPVLTSTLILVFFTMWLLLGSIRRAVFCLIPAGATLLGALGLMHYAEVDLNYLNIIMIPVLFGLGVDGGVHLVTRLASRKEGPETFVPVLSETGRAIAGAILTTSLGFGAMLLADHHGLQTLGIMAVLGLGVNLLSCLVVLPAFLALRLKDQGSENGVNGGEVPAKA